MNCWRNELQHVANIACLFRTSVYGKVGVILAPFKKVWRALNKSTCAESIPKNSFMRISCGNCYFVTEPLRSCQRKVPQVRVCVCVCAWDGRASHTAPIKPLQLTTCSTVHIVYTWKQILLQHAIKCDDVLRVGRSDSVFWGQRVFFLLQIYATLLTSFL